MKQCYIKTILLVLCSLLSMNTSAETTAIVDGLKYSFEGNDAYVIGYDKASIPENLIIPETISYNGLLFRVTEIKDNSFKDCSNIKDLKTSTRLSNIGKNAFNNCTNLKKAAIQSINIDSYAFYNCPKLESATLDGVRYIYEYAFAECIKMKWIDFGNTLQKIGSNAFENCSMLTYLVFPKTLNTICTNNPITYYGNGDYYKFDSWGNKNGIVHFYSNSSPSDFPYKTQTPFIGCSLIQSVIYLGDERIPTGLSNISIYYGKNMIKWNERNFVYSGYSPSPTFTVTNLPAGFQLANNEMQLNLEKNVGTYDTTVPVTLKNNDMEFNIDVPYTYSITPVDLIVKVKNTSRVYGEENPQFNISYLGFINGEDESVFTTQPTISTTATKTSNVGEYPITISGGSANNYEIVYESGVLTITKAPLSANVSDITKVYGSANPSFPIDFIGLKNGETTPAWKTKPTFQTDATQSSGVGQYEVKAVNGVPVNYDLGEITAGTLTITPAPLTIKANNATRQYYSEDPNFSYTCSGFVNGDNESAFSSMPKLTTSANIKSDVGTYIIKAIDASSQNYSMTYVNGTLTITPRTLIASVGNYEKSYGEENPEFEMKYNGFVGEDDENVLVEEATANTTATQTSDAGTYPINVSGGIADNYDFTYTSGILTINQAEQQIVWEQDFSSVRVGDQIELLAETTSSLPISYLVSDESIANLYSVGKKQYLDCFKKGSIVVRAWQDGNNNYLPSVRKSMAIKICPIGDVNRDLKIDVADIATIIDIMAGAKNESTTLADVNNDGIVDVADIATIIDEMAAQARMQEETME